MPKVVSGSRQPNCVLGNKAYSHGRQDRLGPSSTRPLDIPVPSASLTYELTGSRDAPKFVHDPGTYAVWALVRLALVRF